MNLKHKIKDSIEYSVHKKYIQSVQKCIQSVYEAYTKCVQSLHRVYTKCTKCKGQFHAGESLPGQSIPATAQSPLLPSVCLFVCMFVALFVLHDFTCYHMVSHATHAIYTINFICAIYTTNTPHTPCIKTFLFHFTK